MGESTNNNWRDVLAHRVIDTRDNERKNWTKHSRNAGEYVDVLKGLQHFLEYIRSNVNEGNPDLVGDLGGGTTKAIAQLRDSEMGFGLRYEATGLIRNREVNEYLGGKNFHLTTFERLSCFKPFSLGGAISVFGEGYAANPELAMEKLDEKLAPSAVFKANFQHPDKMTPQLTFIPHDRFSKKLRELGYDVAIVDNDACESQILVAIKQPTKIAAQKLLDLDLADYEEQKRMFVLK